MIGFCEFGYRQCESLCDAGCVVWEQRQISVFYFTEKGLLIFCVTHAPAGNGAKATCFPRRGDGVGGGDFVSWGRWAMTGAGGFVSRGWLPNCWTGSLFHGTPPPAKQKCPNITDRQWCGFCFAGGGPTKQNRLCWRRDGDFVSRARWAIMGRVVLFRGLGCRIVGRAFCFAGTPPSETKPPKSFFF